MPTIPRRRFAAATAIGLLLGTTALTACEPPPSSALRERIVAVAQAEVGVTETPLGTNKVPYNGFTNVTWCAHFASWVWQEAGVPGAHLEAYTGDWTNGRQPGTWKPGARNNPMPGDAIIYQGGTTDPWPHIGVVERVDGDMITTIEGNSGPNTDRVYRHGPFDPAAYKGRDGRVVGGYVSPPGESPTPTNPSLGDGATVLPSGPFSGDLWSPHGVLLRMQSDGNLVIVAPGNRPIWSSGTSGNPGAVLTMQADGNLVIYAPGNRPVWATGTAGHPGSVARIQDDGNFAVYAPGNVPIWSANAHV